MAAESIVRVAKLFKTFRRGSEIIEVLIDLNLEVPEGEYLALMGPSVSGKTTLLNLIAGLDSPTSGVIDVGGQIISSMSEAQLAKWRTRNVGFVFQFYHLLPVLSAYENVELPLLLLPLSAAARRKQVLRPGRPLRPATAPSRATFRRPATARGHRPRHRYGPHAHRRRRTHRRPRREVR
jgi:predicted ABC-type transport system involved in lysophospholipase L1 biosynthesis ATPase subunit